jgi:hypothetical protein
MPDTSSAGTSSRSAASRGSTVPSAGRTRRRPRNRTRTATFWYSQRPRRRTTVRASTTAANSPAATSVQSRRTAATSTAATATCQAITCPTVTPAIRPGADSSTGWAREAARCAPVLSWVPVLS